MSSLSSEQKDEFVRKLETRYKDTYNIMLHRDPTYAYLNYNLKNLDCIVEDDKNEHLYYTEEWNEVYKKVINTNIIDIHFDELIKNPIRTITRVIQYTNIDKSIGNTKEIIKVYKHYCDKQRFLENVSKGIEMTKKLEETFNISSTDDEEKEDNTPSIEESKEITELLNAEIENTEKIDAALPW